MNKKVVYQIFVPGGNDTAFVFGTDYKKEEKKIINNVIMQKEKNVEQVGFLGEKEAPELIMAGGEFCGNATRSAAYFYLEGKDGELKLKVNQKDYINAGVKEGLAWCEIPLILDRDIIEEMENDIYKIEMKGMTTIVIKEERAKQYIEKLDTIKDVAMGFIENYNLKEREAVGVMFLEKDKEIIKINPVVWVNAIDTLFYETACGSGTTATAIVESYISGESKSVDVLQPSGHIITATVNIDGKKASRAIICGNIFCNNEIRKFDI